MAGTTGICIAGERCDAQRQNVQQKREILGDLERSSVLRDWFDWHTRFGWVFMRGTESVERGIDTQTRWVDRRLDLID
jgi:hypothetical protein